MQRLKAFDRGELNIPHSAIPNPQFSEAWTLDPLGNWSNYIRKTAGTLDLDQDRTVNKANEITEISETAGISWPAPSYDRAGNMTSIAQSADLSSEYELAWDAWNRLVKVKDNATAVAEYNYDGTQRRVTKTVGSTTCHCFHSIRWQAIEERLDSSPSPDRQFIWGALYIDHLILRDRDPGGSGGLLDERVYSLQDANWNVTGMIDSNGAALERFAFSAYGETTFFDGSHSLRTASDHDWVFQFTGRHYDSETGLRDFRVRMFSCSFGQFVIRDGLNFRDGMQLYRYCTNSPSNHLDPFGQQAMSIGAPASNRYYCQSDGQIQKFSVIRVGVHQGDPDTVGPDVKLPITVGSGKDAMSLGYKKVEGEIDFQIATETTWTLEIGTAGKGFIRRPSRLPIAKLKTFTYESLTKSQWMAYERGELDRHGCRMIFDQICCRLTGEVRKIEPIYVYGVIFLPEGCVVQVPSVPKGQHEGTANESSPQSEGTYYPFQFRPPVD